MFGMGTSVTSSVKSPESSRRAVEGGACRYRFGSKASGESESVSRAIELGRSCLRNCAERLRRVKNQSGQAFAR